MCGIAGVIGSQEKIEKEKTTKLMVAKIFHRGPDEDGYFFDDHVGLGMRRLSIIDLSTGSQPISTDDGRYTIIFNGEIYNYKELRAELIEKGVRFNTESDTEVILEMYRSFGAAFLPRLRGMFAFCIYDNVEKKVFIARDFFGIKPLYYFKRADKIMAFASEIKSLLEHPQLIRQVNDAAVYNYLSYQYNPLEETFFKEVYKLPPGHFLEADIATGAFKIEKYWQFSFKPNDRLSEKATAEKVFETMRDSVKHHLISDVPVGSFLSGGIDSSIIVTLMQKIRGEKKVKTFTVGFDSLSEGREAASTSNFLQTDHTETIVDAESYFKALPDAVWHFDEPVADPSAIGLYFLAREARKHVKVVLSGEGADELFGGYNIYLEPFARQKIAWLPHNFLRWLTKIPFQYSGKHYAERALNRLEDWYIGNATIFTPHERKKLWKREPEETFDIKSLYRKAADKSDSVKMQYIDINTWLVGDILAKADKMTMAHSIELRVPFLDKEVAELAETLPDKLKWKNGTTKYILRQAFKNIIPEDTRRRKKLGFPTPLRRWLDGSRKELYESITSNTYIKNHFDVAYIKQLIADHISRRSDNSRKIYLLLMLSLWYTIYIEPTNL